MRSALITTVTTAVLFAVGFTLSGCEKNGDSGSVRPRIVNGTRVQLGTANYQVALLNADGTSFCGGSLYGSGEWVVTAAHCVNGRSASSIKVGSGDVQLANLKKTSVASISVHPRYVSDGIDYDVAVLKLSQSALGANSSAIAFATLLEEPTLLSSTLRATGYGQIGDTAPVSSNLLETPLVYVSDSQCKTAVGAPWTERLLCAGGVPGQTNGTCFGDSGGPLVSSGSPRKQIGIVMGVIGRCGDANAPDIYTRVTAISGWVGTIVR